MLGFWSHFAEHLLPSIDFSHYHIGGFSRVGSGLQEREVWAAEAWQVDKWAVICWDVNLNGSALIATWDICVATAASERDSSQSRSQSPSQSQLQAHSHSHSHSRPHFPSNFVSSLPSSSGRILNFPTAPDMQIIMIYWLWKICATEATLPKKWEWLQGNFSGRTYRVAGPKRWISQAYWSKLGAGSRLLVFGDKWY